LIGVSNLGSGATTTVPTLHIRKPTQVVVPKYQIPID
jgi:hypothetical protein